MKDCPRCFWLEMHGRWKRPSGIFPSLPSGMDRVLKKHFDNFRDRAELPPELVKTSECGEMRLFGENKDEKELLEAWRDARRGIFYKDEKGNILKGAVDNILVKGRKLIVLDYKTRGYALKDDTHKHYQDQLDVYNFLLRENGLDVENFGFLLFYVPEKVLPSGEVVFSTHLIKMQANPDGAKKLFEDALRMLDGKCPAHHGENACEWCRLIED
jgi:hypothetical protein